MLTALKPPFRPAPVAHPVTYKTVNLQSDAEVVSLRECNCLYVFQENVSHRGLNIKASNDGKYRPCCRVGE